MSRPTPLQLEVAERNAAHLFGLRDDYTRFLRANDFLKGCPEPLKHRAARAFNEVCTAHASAQSTADGLATLDTSFAAIHHTNDQVELARAYNRVAATNQQRLEQGQSVADDYHDAIGETSDLLGDIDATMHNATGGIDGLGVGVNYFADLEQELAHEFADCTLPSSRQSERHPQPAQ